MRQAPTSFDPGVPVGVFLRRTGYGAFVALDERLSRDELVKDGCGKGACSAHGGDGDLLLKREWDGHDRS